MTYGVEQLTSLANANQRFLFRFAEISRSAAVRQVEIAQNSFAALGAQAAEQKPGTVAFPGFAWLTDVLKEVEQNRQTSVAAAQDAIGEWSACVSDAFRPGDIQQPFADVFQTWTQPSRVMMESASPADAGPEKKSSGKAA